MNGRGKSDASGSAQPVVRLFWQSAVYSLGNLALKVAGLLLLPLYLHPDLLSQADYGYLGLLETVAQLAIATTGLGIATGLLRYGSMARESEARDAYLATAFASTAATALLTFLLVWLVAEPVANLLLGDGGRAAIVRWMGLYVALKVVGAVPYMLLRVRERPGRYLAALVAEVTVLVVGVWLALSVWERGLEGVMMAFAASAAASAVPLSALVLARVRSSWKPQLARQLLRFGLPLTVAALAGILLNTGDRFVLLGLTDAEVLAVYVLATKFGGLVNMLFVQSFNMGFSVLGLKALGQGDGVDFHRRVFRHFVVLAGWGVLAVSLLARDVTDWLSPNPAFLDAEPLVLPIAFGFLMYGVYYIVVNVLYAEARSGGVALLVLGAAGFNILLNFALIPLFGAMGAAIATLASYGALASVSVLQTRHRSDLRLRWSALAIVGALVVGLWLLAQPSGHWSVEARLALRAGIIGAYPLLILASGTYGLKELRAMARSVRD